MEIQIQDLITSIKTDGIEKAKAEAAEIISKAKAEAEAIIRDANQEREKILSNARREIETESRSAEEKLRQAADSIGLAISENMVRGGTDGAHLASHGIASPDIFTGGHNLHSLSEWIALESMERSLELVLAIAKGDA